MARIALNFRHCSSPFNKGHCGIVFFKALTFSQWKHFPCITESAYAFTLNLLSLE